MFLGIDEGGQHVEGLLINMKQIFGVANFGFEVFGIAIIKMTFVQVLQFVQKGTTRLCECFCLNINVIFQTSSEFWFLCLVSHLRRHAFLRRSVPNFAVRSNHDEYSC